MKGRVQLFARDDIYRHAFALVAILWLEHHRQANFLRCSPGVVSVGHWPPVGYRHTSGEQQLFGQVFVLGNGFGHRTGAVQFGCLDAALARAPAKLHQATLGQAFVGDPACDGCIHNRAGAGPQALVFIEVTQLGQRGVQVETGFAQSGMHQCLRQFQCQAAHRFFGVLHHGLIHAAVCGACGAAESDRATGVGLQGQRGRLQHVGQ